MRLITRGVKVSPQCEFQKKKHKCELFGWKDYKGKLYCNKHYRMLIKKERKEKDENKHESKGKALEA